MAQRRFTSAEFGRTLWRAVAPPLLLLAAHAVLLSLLCLYWIRATDWSRHTERAISAVHDLERQLVNMETGYRGWLLTRDPAFLTPYTATRHSVPAAISSLRDLMGSNPLHASRLNEIDKTFARWTESQDRTSPTTDEMNSRKDQMDSMRRAMQAMILTESAAKNNQYDRERRAATIAVGGGIGVSILLAIALAFINRRTVLDLSSAYQRVLDEETASSRQFVDLAEAVPQLIWITDRDGKHTYFNRPWTQFTGVQDSDLASKGWEQWLHPEDQASAVAKWNHSRATGEAFESEYRLKRGTDGSYRWFLCRAVSVRDKDGKPTRWFGSCTDIENQKQTQKARDALLAAERQARSDLIRTSRVKDEFLATLSHELRTPMTAILGWARLLRDPKLREKNLDRAIEAIDSSAKAQARLIEDLLDMNRILSGKLTIQPEFIDLKTIIQDAATAVVPAVNNKKISLTIDLGDSGPMFISGDPARLQQVVWNLLSNAVKFTPSGGSVAVRLEQTESMARLRISDTGHGIAAAFLPHVFERFRQADGSTTRHQGGLGLGLAIVRSLVEMHGGSVSVESAGEGAGATFTVELPLGGHDRADAQAGPTEVSAAEGAANALIPGKRILVVDDDAATASMIRTILEHTGAEVDVAGSAAGALELVRKNNFDLMISDIGMPEMDGYALRHEVCKHEKATATRLRTMALTAFARTEDRKRALDAGYDQHLAKPVLPDLLVSAVAQVLTLD